jgi:hypothetical protein
VAGHFSSLIPSQGTAQVGWKRTHRFSKPVAQILRTAIPCQVYEDDEARGSFNQCGDGRATALSNY